jgi:hypothetical protein
MLAWICVTAHTGFTRKNMSNFNADWHIQESLNEVGKGVIKSYLRGITGDIVEFGTMTGRSSEALAAAIAASESVYEKKMPRLGVESRNLYLFDSFEGLPAATEEADIRSPIVASGVWGPGTCFGITPEQLRAVCGKHLADERIHIFEGWFKNTISLLDSEIQFALVHVDCDLYSSTRDVLDGLFSRGQIADGAMVYFDDWDCNASRPDLGERQAWSEAVKKYSIEFSASHAYAAVGQAMIVHGYDGFSR